jgi:hypothetical protein
MHVNKELMMKQNWTMYIYKLDRRTKQGERRVSTTVWEGRDAATMDREVQELFLSGAYTVDKFRIEVVPTTKWVKNLMTGQLVEIPHDTPWSCDPSSELYWTM